MAISPPTQHLHCMVVVGLFSRTGGNCSDPFFQKLSQKSIAEDNADQASNQDKRSHIYRNLVANIPSLYTQLIYLGQLVSFMLFGLYGRAYVKMFQTHRVMMTTTPALTQKKRRNNSHHVFLYSDAFCSSIYNFSIKKITKSF